MRLPFDLPLVEPPPVLAPAVPPREVPPEGGPPLAPPVVHFVRHPRARRYVLRVQPDGSVRVTIPRAGSRREGEAFLQRSRHWVDRHRAKVLAAGRRRVLAAGDLVLLGGVRTPVQVEASDHRVRVRVGGAEASARPPADVAMLVSMALRAEAERQLPARLRALADQVGLTAGRVTIRNQRGRWGSCARSGSISLNWRLVQMPPEVRDYVLLHELMHLREPNHSRRFWRHVASACPWHLEARRWLSREGRTLL
jgi:predicted metal-dependent hydrolase